MVFHNLLNGRIARNVCKQIFSQVRRNGNWHLEHLRERTVLKLQGEKCTEFLQGLITNDINLLNNQKALYAMFLNTKGRILYDTIIYKTNCNDTLFLECDVACAGDVEKHLKMYRVRRKIDISLGEYAVWAIFLPSFEKDYDFKVELSEKCILCPDPRQSNLGYRAVVSQDTNLDTNSTDNIKISYKLHRYRLGIAEGVDELPIGKCFPLEMNCDYLNGVSFNKGCYIGQELTARTYHTGVVRKRLMPLLFLSPPENVYVEDPIMESSSLKPSTVGKLRGVFVDTGLGLMRVKETLAATSLTIRNIPLKSPKPFWWPLSSEEYELKKHV